MVIWPQVVGLLVVGYLCMTRSFAYLGVPAASIFIGEVVLAAFLLLKPRVVLGTWVASLLRPSPLHALGLALLLFMLYGVWQVGRGVAAGSSLLYTFKFFIFNYYAFYIFLGIWVGVQSPDFLARLARVVAWTHGVYGVLWISGLDKLALFLPGTEVKLFGWPGGGAVAILALLCFERNLRSVWPVLALNIVVTLAQQHRAEWLGLALGALVWGLLARRLGRVVAMGVAGLLVIGMIELAGVDMPGRTGSGVTLAETVGRALAPLDTELAQELSPNAGRHASTMEWREKWWEQIWLSVHSTLMLEAFGHGYGFDLFSLAPDDVRTGQEDWDVRTPHSVFYFALGYTGWVGVALFVVFQFTIVRLLWRAFILSGQPAGVVFWIMGMAMACFEQSFDTPYRAIPFYLLAGLAMAPALQWRGDLHARPARAQLLSVARW